jgi:15-cis-phytoene synthase
MTPQQYVQDKAARSGSSFYYAFLFLPPPRRAAITAFYAFCREVDDVVDEVSDPGVAAAKLAWWRGEIGQAFAGHPGHPVTQALLPLAPDYGIEPGHLLAVVDGCQIDLEQSRFLDFAALQRYCHLVAGVVGEVAANIFGRTAEGTVAYARQLGLAMQLTNIIRDVGDDARRGRVYLPLSELQRFDVKVNELLRLEAPWGYSTRFDSLMRFQAERAHATFDAAMRLLPDADRATQRPGLMMANIYRTLLREIESQRFQVLHQRTSLTPLRKMWIATRTHLSGR